MSRHCSNPNRSLYDNNKAVYSLLRYGVPVKIEAGKVTDTVKLIDWEHPENNDFVIIEEVTLHGNHERRPDLVLYVNGIAVAVLELKKSSVSISEGSSAASRSLSRRSQFLKLCRPLQPSCLRRCSIQRSWRRLGTGEQTPASKKSRRSCGM
jgi:type I site-specific restriction-modification system R (restriction) subunit